MATTIDKKYLSLTRLTEYDVAIKGYVDAHDATILADAKSYADGLVGKITSGTTVVKEAEHADTATTATKATQDENGKNIASTYETKADASAKLTEAKTYTDTEVAKKADSDHDHNDDYDEKGAAATAESNAKAYADAAADAVKDDLLNGAGDAYDTLKELGDLIDDNADAIDVLELVAAGKADADHDHAIADVTELQTALNAKLDKTSFDSHTGTHAPSNAQANIIESIKVNGTAQTIMDKVVDIIVPTNNNQLINGAGYLVAADIVNKADKATTLAEYGIVDAYTKSEVDAKTAIDDALSSTSTNPVQNKAINSAITTLTSTIGTNTAAISANTAAIAEFEEITSAEIQALFA